MNKTKCPHCAFLDYLFEPEGIQSNREYWLFTEMYVYLHDGKDYCDFDKKEAIKNESKKD